MSNTRPLDILIKAETQGLYDKLLNQLQKDITRAGLERDFELGTQPHVVSRNLIAQVYALIVTDFERYLNLLYIIDIPEIAIKRLDVQQVDQLAQAVSCLMLDRELQKVSYSTR